MLLWEAVRGRRDGALTMGRVDEDDECSEVSDVSGTYITIGVSGSGDVVSGEFAIYRRACLAAAESVRDEVGDEVGY